MDVVKQKAQKDEQLADKQAFEGKELPSVKQLASVLGVHVYTSVERDPVITGDNTKCPVGVPLARLFVLNEPVTPYLPLDQLDCMVIGILALSPAIKAAVDNAKKQVETE